MGAEIDIANLIVEAVGGVPGVMTVVGTQRKRNADRLTELLRGRIDLTPEQLEQMLTERPVLLELLATAVDQAVRTAQTKRQTMIASLVAAAFDPEQPIDELLVMQRAVDRLDDPHITLLVLIDTKTNETDGPFDGEWRAPTDDGLREAWPAAAALIAPLRQTLVAEGLVEDVTAATWAGLDKASAHHGLSSFGQRLLAHYRALGGT